MDDLYTTKLNAKKVEILYEQGIVALFASILVFFVLLLIYWQRFYSDNILQVWSFLFILATSIRYYEIYLYKKNKAKDQVGKWLIRFNVGVFIAGSLWGWFAILMLHSINSNEMLIIIVCFAGMLAGASALYSSSFITFVLFSTPMTLPPVIDSIIGGDVMKIIPVLLLLIFYSIMLVNSWRLNIFMTKSLGHQFKNIKLMADLEDQNNRISNLNKKLERDIQEKILMEEKLIQEKESAEQLASQMETLSSKDGLTGINNRRRFDEMLLNEWNRSARSGTPLSLILCDIDYFKPYNDLYGHQAGDKCLTRIAHLLEDFTRRGGDVAARYGGEEFTIILPETLTENAEIIAENIRSAIEDLQIPHEASQVKDIVTVSFGVASMVPPRNKSSEILVKTADKALYKAKDAGRNRVIAAESRNACT